jgi:hypothetical protein
MIHTVGIIKAATHQLCTKAIAMCRLITLQSMIPSHACLAELHMNMSSMKAGMQDKLTIQPSLMALASSYA